MTEERLIKEFLEKVDFDFPIPLSKKVNLKEYANKLKEKATLFYEKKEDKIVGMVAGYTQNLTQNLAYIALVATLKEYRGQGFAQKAVSNFLNYCRENNIAGVHLYTAPSNVHAIKLYKSLGFEEYKLLNEPRKKDLHLICYF